ncbi:TadE/TadG family type IV pilus assembly protein [Propionivibrio limicola]|uniref:TadE/TadG family type IV pilus assembly protein n=1 Tax=Propionivibrio limicola TaxID=167645 RepID=UPI001291BACC|nr:TadE/TadG family type IV pilus assembly protein [Propionivibrio limicola]
MRKLMKGVAAVEFGILLIPLVILVFGITEYGRAIYTYNTLTKSVRDAARYLTSQTPGDTNEHATAKCMAAFGNPDCSGSPLAPGLTTGMVQTCDRILTCGGVTTSLSTGSGTINLVVVRIQGYPYDSFVEFVMPDITFEAISTSMRGQL